MTAEFVKPDSKNLNFHFGSILFFAALLLLAGCNATAQHFSKGRALVEASHSNESGQWYLVTVKGDGAATRAEVLDMLHLGAAKFSQSKKNTHYLALPPTFSVTKLHRYSIGEVASYQNGEFNFRPISEQEISSILGSKKNLYENKIVIESNKNL